MNLRQFVRAAREAPDPTAWTEIERKFWEEHKEAINNALSEEMRKHVWEEGVGLFVWFRKGLPTAYELAFDMFDEWDDPVSEKDAKLYLAILKRVANAA
jgi:hypothetical protein